LTIMFKVQGLCKYSETDLVRGPPISVDAHSLDTHKRIHFLN